MGKSYERVPEATITDALKAGKSVEQLARDNKMNVRSLRRRLKRLRLSKPAEDGNGRMPRILVIDIETAPIEAFVWKIFDENVGVDQIKTDTSILSFAAKWIGKDEVIYRDTGGRGVDKVRDDSVLMQPLWDLLHEADIVVAQNGQAFDVKRINARLLFHGFKPYSPIKVADTKWMAKRMFAFTSNKLEWMSHQYGGIQKSKHHKYPGFELWLEVLKDNPDAWKEMRKYNIIDTLGCEELYLKFLAWDPKHPNVGTYDPSPARRCTHCGSQHVREDGYTVLQATIYKRYVCDTCGGWSRGKVMQTDSQTRKRKLA